jgi:hypothetical protein
MSKKLENFKFFFLPCVFLLFNWSYLLSTFTKKSSNYLVRFLFFQILGSIGEDPQP